MENQYTEHFSRRNTIISHDLLSVDDVSILMGVSYDTAAATIRDIRRGLELTTGTKNALYRLNNGDLVGIKKTEEGYKVAIEKTDGSGEKKILTKAFSDSDINEVLAKLNKETGRATKSVSKGVVENANKPIAVKSVSAVIAQKATETVANTESSKTEDTKKAEKADTSDTVKKVAKEETAAESKTEKKAEAKPKETETPKPTSKQDTNTEAKKQEKTKTAKPKSQTAQQSKSALNKARKALASLSKNDARLKGGYVQDGKQYLSNGIYVVAFNDIDTDIETASESYPIQRLSDYLNQVKENATEKDLVVIDLAALKEVTPTKISEMDNVNAKLGNGFYRAALVSRVLSALDKEWRQAEICARTVRVCSS